MNKVYQTIKEIDKVLSSKKIPFVLTRFNPERKAEPGDLDILVKSADFEDAIKAMRKFGYTCLSHDKALGGREKGAQINLVKKARIKVDLHKDFTWRKKRYFDVSSIWKTKKHKKISGVKIPVPSSKYDAFLAMINVIFEKTYFKKEEYNTFWKNKELVFKDDELTNYAVKFGWWRTFNKFKRWSEGRRELGKPPFFIPTSIVLLSYLEKFDLISLIYYLFFRIRYVVNKKLPYD